MKKWFKAMAADGVATITIDGEIGFSWWDGDGAQSNLFMRDVKALGELTEIRIDLNSPGGSVTDGLTIANYLRQHAARVVVNVLGQASSIASVIAAAGDEVHMGLGSFMMVHQPWTVILGNADEMRAMAKDLDTINDGILDAYVAKVGEPNREAMLQLVRGDDGQGTILSAEAAIEIGLADSMMEVRAAASACMGRLARSMAKASTDAKACGCLKAGARLGAFLDSEIESLVTEERTRADVISEMATAAGISESTVENILSGNIDCPPRERLEGFAEVLSASVDDMIREAEGDGCDYSEDDDAEAVTVEKVMAKYPHLREHLDPGVQADFDIQGLLQVCPGIINAYRDEAVTAAKSAERDRINAIIKACETTGSFGPLEKMVNEDWEASKASDYILAAAANQQQIHSSHSPEGGQVKLLSSSEIYDKRRQARR